MRYERYGSGTLRLAIESARGWKQRMEKLSPRYTTRREDIIEVRGWDISFLTAGLRIFPVMRGAHPYQTQSGNPAMANPEHVAILKQGVEVWNSWRWENLGIVPDLREANLGGTNLSGTNFSGANLMKAILCKADLSKAHLSRAELSGADLSRAELIETNLSKVNLRGVDLKNARCFQTIFANVDLSETKNLDSVDHKGPSSIGIDTLYKSKGNILEMFLLGCGVPDQMIEYTKSLTANPIEYYSCFISYSHNDHNDEEFAKRLWEGLQAKNVRCWLACEDMKIGAEIRTTIDESIRVHDKLLIILSKHSVGSEWVKDEVEHAIDLEKERKQSVLFPVRIDETVMESKTGWSANVRRQRHIGDFTRWKDHDAYSKAFERLLRDLKAEG